MSSSQGGRVGFKLTIKRTSTQQNAQNKANGTSTVAATSQPGSSGLVNAGSAIPSSGGPTSSAPRQQSNTLPSASQPGALPRQRLSLKGASRAAVSAGTAPPPVPAAAHAPAAPSPVSAAAATPNAGAPRPRGIILKGASNKATGASPASRPSPTGISLKAQAKTIALEAAAAAGAAPAAATPAASRKPVLTSTPASRPSPAPVAASTPATPAAAAAAATPGGMPIKKLGIKLKGAGQPRPAPTTPAAAGTGAAGQPASASAASAPPKPRITLNKSRSMAKPLGSSAGAFDSSSGYDGSYYNTYDHQYHGGLAGHYQAPASAAATSTYGNNDYSSTPYGSSDPYTAPMDRSTGLADAAQLAAGAGMAPSPASAAPTPAHYAAYPVTGQKRGRPPGARPPARDNLGSHPTPLGPRAKRPKIGQFRDRDDDEASDEDFNPKAERLQQRAAAHAVAGARHKATGHRASAGHWNRGQQRTAAARHAVAAAARHAHVAKQQKEQQYQQQQQWMQQQQQQHHQPQPHQPYHVSTTIAPLAERAAAEAPAAAAAQQPAAPAAAAGGVSSDMPMSAADAAAAFARMTSTPDGAAAFGIAPMDAEPAAETGAGASAAGAAGHAGNAAAPAQLPPPPAHPRVQKKPPAPVVLVDPVLLAEVDATEETHPATRESMTKLLTAVDKRDKFRFFTTPVTDAVAPNYSKVIKQPMDLSTMKQKVEKGIYKTWSDLQADLVLMFTNAKTYNAPTTVVHKQADVLLTASLKMVKNFKQGKTKLRGFTGNTPTQPLPPPPAPVGERAAKADKSEKAAGGGAPPPPPGPMVTRQTRRGRVRREDDAPQPKRMRGTKFIPLANNNAADYSTTTTEGDTFRDTYRCKPRTYGGHMCGLADGANPEGVPYGGNGRPVLRCIAGHINNLHPEYYMKSLGRFVAGAGSAVEQLVMQMMGTQLQQLMPVKGVTPAHMQRQQHNAGHHQQQQQLQQQQQQHRLQHPQHMQPQLQQTAAAAAAAAQQQRLRPPGVGGVPVSGAPVSAAAAAATTATQALNMPGMQSLQLQQQLQFQHQQQQQLQLLQQQQQAQQQRQQQQQMLAAGRQQQFAAAPGQQQQQGQFIPGPNLPHGFMAGAAASQGLAMPQAAGVLQMPAGLALPVRQQ